MVVILNIIITF